MGNITFREMFHSDSPFNVHENTVPALLRPAGIQTLQQQHTGTVMWGNSC